MRGCQGVSFGAKVGLTGARMGTGEEMPDDLFTMAEATRYLQASRLTIERYIVIHGLAFERSAEGMLTFRRRELDRVRPILDENRERFNTRRGAEKRRKKTGETEEGE